MRKEKALLIVGQSIVASSHHRGQHIANYLAKEFMELDVVSFTKMYDGPGTDALWKKVLLGFRDILYKRVITVRNGNVKQYIVRIPHLPSAFDYLFRDFWTYANVHTHLNGYYDLCILGDPRAAYVAMRLKELGKVGVLIYDDWDYFPGEHSNDPLWRFIIGYRESVCVRTADGVVSVSSYLEEFRRKQGAKRTTIVPNGVDYAHFEGAQRKETHPPTLLYMGTLAKPWGVDLPIRALPIIKRQIPETRYLVIGGGPGENQLRGLVAELCLGDCVRFYGRQNYEDLPSFMVDADIGIATSRDTDFRRYACPLKIMEYMAAGLAVIGTRVGETMIIIEKSKAGETVDFSVEAFARVAVDLLSSRSKYERYSANAISFAREHDWELVLGKELAFIDQLP
jgi:glycosyltransferase involved in cell wall biosynthesis